MAVYHRDADGNLTSATLTDSDREELDRLIQLARSLREKNRMPRQGKTLRNLLKEELRTEEDDKVDAVADVVLDWLGRVEYNGNLSLASYWREQAERMRKDENEAGVGR